MPHYDKDDRPLNMKLITIILLLIDISQFFSKQEKSVFKEMVNTLTN